MVGPLYIKLITSVNPAFPKLITLPLLNIYYRVNVKECNRSNQHNRWPCYSNRLKLPCNSNRLSQCNYNSNRFPVIYPMSGVQ